MKIAAGVILIIAAVFNLFAGLLYLGGGAATSGLNDAVDSAVVQQQMTDEERAEMERVQDEVGGSAMGFMAFGVFLLVSVGILIAGAVFLFTNKKAQFILAAGAMAIAAEVIGAFITSDVGITNLVGIVGGVLAIICARSMGQSEAAPVE